MVKCPVCGNQLSSSACKCGFDMSTHYEAYYSLAPINGRKIKSIEGMKKDLVAKTKSRSSLEQYQDKKSAAFHYNEYNEEKKYLEAVACYRENSIDSVKKSISMFNQLGNYQNSVALKVLALDKLVRLNQTEFDDQTPKKKRDNNDCAICGNESNVYYENQVTWSGENPRNTPELANITKNDNDEKQCFEITDDELVKYYGTDQSVRIPDGVVVIGAGAFQDNTEVKRVVLPGSVLAIMHEAFSGCSNLNDIYIPETVEFIGYEAFAGCLSIKSVRLPKSLEKLSPRTFAECKSLNKAYIEHITHIGAEAFANCENLEVIWFSSDLVQIGLRAFKRCSNLKSIRLPGSLGNFKCIAEEKNPYAQLNGDDAFQDCYGLEKVTFEDGITELPAHFFSRCVKLNKVFLPSTLKRIGMCAFDGCTNLQSIDIPPDVSDMAQTVFRGCSVLSRVTLPERISRIRNNTFDNCLALKEIIIPNNVKEIDSRAFYNCVSLADVRLTKGLETIESQAFDGCPALRQITIPETVVKMRAAFQNCTNLEMITIQGSTMIEQERFWPIKKQFKLSVSMAWKKNNAKIYKTYLEDRLYWMTK